MRRFTSAALHGVTTLASHSSASSRAIVVPAPLRAVAPKAKAKALGSSAPLCSVGLAAYRGLGRAGWRKLTTHPAGDEWHKAPKAWDDGGEATNVEYTQADIATWRAEFGFARRQHSLASIGYTDEELLEWRRPFEQLAQENRISFPAFESFVARKYSGVTLVDQLAQKVRSFWNQFDADKDGFVDFGEFMAAGLLFDVDWAKEKIRKDGIEATFAEYAEDGFMAEPQFFQLMCDFRFFVATATDVKKLISIADKDGDGLVSFTDFTQWVESSDMEGVNAPAGRRGRGKKGRPRVTLPPPEPEG